MIVPRVELDLLLRDALVAAGARLLEETTARSLTRGGGGFDGDGFGCGRFDGDGFGCGRFDGGDSRRLKHPTPTDPPS